MKKIVKTISIMICGIFTVQTVVWSAPSVFTVKVDEKHGTVAQRYKGTTEKVVVHVQDAHANSEAQENLARIICELLPQISEPQSLSSTPFIGIEGSFSTYDLGTLSRHPVKEAREIVGRDLVKEGKIIAAEYANIISDDAFSIVGLEDKELFNQDLSVFNTVMRESGSLMEEVNGLEEALAGLKEELFNDALAQFDTMALQFENDPNQLLSNLGEVYSHIDSTGLDILDYVNLLQFKEVFFIEKTIDANLLAKEIEHLVAAIDTRPPVSVLYASYKDGAITEKAFLKNITPVAMQSGVTLSEYPNIQRKMQYWNKYALIDMGELIRETHTASTDIRVALADTPEAAKVVDIGSRLRLLKKLCTLRAVKEEVEEFRSRLNDFDLSAIRGELVEIGQTLPNGQNSLSPDRVGLGSGGLEGAEVGALVDDFYRVADARDAAMLDNLLKEMETSGQDMGVLVAGGYHSEGLVRLMKERGLSYVTVTPTIDSVKEDIPYLERLTGKIAPLAPGLMTTTMQANHINASVQAINSSAFQQIVSEAGVRINGQSVLRADGALLSADEIRARAAEIRKENSTNDKDAALFADILEGMTDSIEGIVNEVVRENATNEENVAAVMEKLRPILQQRIGELIEDRVVGEALLESFMSEMNASFLELVAVQGSAEEKGSGETTTSQSPNPESQETGPITFDQMVEMLGESADEDMTQEALELLMDERELLKEEIEILKKEPDLASNKASKERIKEIEESLLDVKVYIERVIVELKDKIEKAERKPKRKIKLNAQLAVWEFILKIEGKGKEDGGKGWDAGSGFEAPDPTPTPVDPTSPTPAPTPTPDGPDTTGGEGTDLTPPPAPPGPAPGEAPGAEAPTVPDGGEAGSGAGLAAPSVENPDDPGGEVPGASQSSDVETRQGATVQAKTENSDQSSVTRDQVSDVETRQGTSVQSSIVNGVEGIDTSDQSAVTGDQVSGSSIEQRAVDPKTDSTQAEPIVTNPNHNISNVPQAETGIEEENVDIEQERAPEIATEIATENTETPDTIHSVILSGSEESQGSFGTPQDDMGDTTLAQTDATTPIAGTLDTFGATSGLIIDTGVDELTLDPGEMLDSVVIAQQSAAQVAELLPQRADLAPIFTAFTTIGLIGQTSVSGSHLTDSMITSAGAVGAQLSAAPLTSRFSSQQELLQLLQMLQSLILLSEQSQGLLLASQNVVQSQIARHAAAIDGAIDTVEEIEASVDQEYAQNSLRTIEEVQDRLSDFNSALGERFDAALLSAIAMSVETRLGASGVSGAAFTAGTLEEMIDLITDQVIDLIGESINRNDSAIFTEEHFLDAVLSGVQNAISNEPDAATDAMRALEVELLTALGRGVVDSQQLRVDSQQGTKGDGVESVIPSDSEESQTAQNHVTNTIQSITELLQLIVEHDGQRGDVAEMMTILDALQSHMASKKAETPIALLSLSSLLETMQTEIARNRIASSNPALRESMTQVITVLNDSGFVSEQSEMSAQLNALLSDINRLGVGVDTLSVDPLVQGLNDPAFQSLSDVAGNAVVIGDLTFIVETEAYDPNDVAQKLPLVADIVTRTMYGYGDTSIRRVVISDETPETGLAVDTINVRTQSVIDFDTERSKTLFDFVDFEGFLRGDADAALLGYEIMHEVGTRSESATDMIAQLYGAEFKEFVKGMTMRLPQSDEEANTTSFDGLHDPELQKVLLQDGTYDAEAFRDTFLSKLSDDILIDTERVGDVLNADGTLNEETLVYLFASMMKKVLLSTFEISDRPDGQSAEDAFKEVIEKTFKLWGNTLDLFVTTTEGEDQEVSLLKDALQIFFDLSVQKAMGEFGDDGTLTTAVGFWGSLLKIYQTISTGFSEQVLLNAFKTLGDESDAGALARFEKILREFLGFKREREEGDDKKLEVWVLNDRLTPHEVQHVKNQSGKLGIVVVTFNEYLDWLSENWDTDKVVYYVGVDEESKEEDEMITQVNPDVRIFVGEDEQAIERMLAVFRFDIVRMVMNIAYEKGEEIVQVTQPAGVDESLHMTVFPDLSAYPERDKEILKNVTNMMKDKVFLLAA